MRGLLMLMLVIWSSWGLADTLVWGKLRDGDLYLNTEREATLTLRWQPAWQADANDEQLYLLDGHGRLMHQIDVDASQTRGVRQFALGRGDGDHRLSVPGYSFRAWEVEVPGYVQPCTSRSSSTSTRKSAPASSCISAWRRGSRPALPASTTVA